MGIGELFIDSAKRPGTHWEPRPEEMTRRHAAGAVNWLVATRTQDAQR
jgi:hypothetical protein